MFFKLYVLAKGNFSIFTVKHYVIQLVIVYLISFMNPLDIKYYAKLELKVMYLISIMNMG